MQGYDESPFQALPPVVVALALAVALPELALSAADRGLLGAGAAGWRIEALKALGVFPRLLDLGAARGDVIAAEPWRLATFPFVHRGFADMLFGVVFVLALGKFVAEAMGTLATLAVFFGAAIFGALLWWALGGASAPLAGAYVPAYGLIGAFTFVLFTRAGAAGGSRLAAFRLIGFLMAIQLAFSLLFGAADWWMGEMAGFLFGFAISFVAAPGRARVFLERIRSR
ncbi:membrane associated rhomboid family serine protease [Hasllibacter halocynthiae]|uniref:Membrane associated rhomboid family serine protease n=1 Tax=Hasllibacter halocynthiae TaxID=595589 RepID=A0A2T0X1Z9_9RHOB|nr:rhomboid family intramembrane serine protease [Hasllibacter halocynthiae]PRY92976.1 membrane associated rhomboid family serine protease [Hasllibacter halocynthiae]